MFSDEFIKQLEKKNIYKNVYSKDEIVVGEYMGKPLYRKVLTFTQTLTNNVSTSHQIENLDKMINARGWIRNLSWGQIPVPMVHNYIDGMISFANFNSNNFTWFVGADIAANLVNAQVELTVEYTKTTD